MMPEKPCLLLDNNIWRSGMARSMLIGFRNAGKIKIATYPAIVEEFLTPPNTNILKAKERLELIRDNSDLWLVEPTKAFRVLSEWAKQPREKAKSFSGPFLSMSKMDMGRLIADYAAAIDAGNSQLFEAARQTRKDRQTKWQTDMQKIFDDVVAELTELNKGNIRAADGSAKRLTESCLKHGTRFSGFPMPMLLSVFKLDLDPQLPSGPAKYGQGLSKLVTAYAHLDGVRLFNAHIASEIFSQYETSSFGQAVDATAFDDSLHLLYVSKKRRLVSEDKGLLETARTFPSSIGPLVLDLNDIKQL